VDALVGPVMAVQAAGTAALLKAAAEEIAQLGPVAVVLDADAAGVNVFWIMDVNRSMEP
jgi:hypothetical protein